MIDCSVQPPSCRRRPVSTTHMRCPPSSGNSLISWFSLPWSVAAHGCLKGTPAPGLGGDAGVKSRRPLAGARSAGLEAGITTQAQSFVSFGSDRSCSQLHSALSSRCKSQPCRSCGVAPHQLISGRHSEWLHHKPPCLGQRAGRSGPFFHYGVFQPVVDAVPCPGLRRADQARPNLGVSVIAWRGVPSSFRPAFRSRGLQHGTLRHHAVLDVAPQRDEQLARQRNDGDALHARALALDPLVEPLRQRRVRADGAATTRRAQ